MPSVSAANCRYSSMISGFVRGWNFSSSSTSRCLTRSTRACCINGSDVSEGENVGAYSTILLLPLSFSSRSRSPSKVCRLR